MKKPIAGVAETLRGGSGPFHGFTRGIRESTKPVGDADAPRRRPGTDGETDLLLTETDSTSGKEPTGAGEDGDPLSQNLDAAVGKPVSS